MALQFHQLMVNVEVYSMNIFLWVVHLDITRLSQSYSWAHPFLSHLCSITYTLDPVLAKVKWSTNYQPRKLVLSIDSLLSALTLVLFGALFFFCKWQKSGSMNLTWRRDFLSHRTEKSGRARPGNPRIAIILSSPLPSSSWVSFFLSSSSSSSSFSLFSSCLLVFPRREAGGVW